MEQEDIAQQVIDASIKIHKTLGPGLLESAYQTCLAYELRQRGLKAETEVEQEVVYENLRIDTGYRIDLLVEDCVIIENKAVDALLPVHYSQVLTYMRLRNCSLGFLINWKVRLIKDGIHRLVNSHPTRPYSHVSPAK